MALQSHSSDKNFIIALNEINDLRDFGRQKFGNSDSRNNAMIIYNLTQEDEVCPLSKEIYLYRQLQSPQKRMFFNFLEDSITILDQEAFQKYNTQYQLQSLKNDPQNKTFKTQESLRNSTHNQTSRYNSKSPSITDRTSNFTRFQKRLPNIQQSTLRKTNFRLQNMQQLNKLGLLSSVQNKSSNSRSQSSKRINQIQNSILKNTALSSEHKFQLQQKFQDLNKTLSDDDGSLYYSKFKFLKAKPRHYEVIKKLRS